jgi:hypothetical protein
VGMGRWKLQFPTQNSCTSYLESLECGQRKKFVPFPLTEIFMQIL